MYHRKQLEDLKKSTKMSRKISLVLLVVLLVCSSAVCVAQQTFRIQGYLIMETYKSASPSKKYDHVVQIDNPRFYFFKPLKSVSSSSFDNLLSIENPKDEELFLPMGLTETERSIRQTNSDFKFYTGVDVESFNQILEENKLFHKTQKTVIKLKNDKLKNVVYKVVYIDGIWIKVTMPFRFRNVVSVGRYLSSQLDPDKKDGYEWYFLKEIKAISYNLKFNDESIIQLE